MTINFTKETIKLFWQHAWRHPAYVIGLMIMMPTTIFVHQFLPPLIAANVMNRLSKGDFKANDLWGSFGSDLLLYAAAVMIGGIVCWRIIIILIWKLEAMVLRDIANRTFAHLVTMSANFHSNRFGGSLVSQASKLGRSYVRMADTTTFQVSGLVLSLVFAVIILAPRAPLFVLLLIALSLLFVVISIFASKSIRDLNAAEATAESKQTGYLADNITNIMAVKSFAREQTENQRFAQATEFTRKTVMQVMRATVKRDALYSTVTTSIETMSLVLAAASVVLFNADIATVFLVVNYTANVVSKLWDFSTSSLRNYNRALGDARDMVEILHIQPEVKDPAKPQKITMDKGQITFAGVTFTHPEAGEALFRDLDLSIQPGEKIGLVGHSGSGKTTLTKLLLRFNDIDGGTITIDGQNIADVRQADLRSRIAYVPQEPNLFHRTIAENIAYGKPDASQEEIELAARKAHAHEFINKIPHKYQTLVGERGVKLSGGQRQRVAIARAILKDAPILVLDEATSALDSESELLIQAALWELMKNRTAIVIAHRLSTVQKMDRIVVMDDGKIIEQGSHAELIAQHGEYAKLWSHQSGGFIED